MKKKKIEKIKLIETMAIPVTWKLKVDGEDKYAYHTGQKVELLRLQIEQLIDSLNRLNKK